MGTLQFISCIRFSLQLILAELTFAGVWKKRQNFVPRAAAALAAYFALAWCVFRTGKIMPDGPAVMILYYFVLLTLTLAGLWVCFDIGIAQAFMAGLCGYSLQHMAFCASMILTTAFHWSLNGIAGNILFRFLIYLAFDFFFYWFIIRRMQREEDWEPDVRMLFLSFAVLFCAIVLSVLVDSTLFADSSVLLTDVICKLYGIVCCALAIATAFNVTRNNYLRREQEMMEGMLHSLKDQSRLSRDSINIINIKSHDLKYRLNHIQKIENTKDQQEYIEEIRDAVTMYDNIYQTGNDSLDLVLTEKSIFCKENGIRISSMIDGSCLHFISSTDIYAMFSNLLDNAIESVMQEPDREKRLISIKIARGGGGSFVHMENYTTKDPSFEDGLPVTTKKDRNFHGFGVRSIRYIVEKYHGSLLMQSRNHRFITDILFYE